MSGKMCQSFYLACWRSTSFRTGHFASLSPVFSSLSPCLAVQRITARRGRLLYLGYSASAGGQFGDPSMQRPTFDDFVKSFRLIDTAAL